MKKKFNLTVQCDDPLQQSIYTQIIPQGLKLLENNILIGTQGLEDQHGQQIIQKIKPQQIQIYNNQLGKGAACIVKQGYYKTKNMPVAVKSINIYDRSKKHQLKHDLNIFLNLKREAECSFLVKIFGCYFEQGTVKVIMQLMNLGSLAGLYAHLQQINIMKIPESILAKISIQILSGLGYLHINNIIHRDIKPENILLNRQGQVKLTDFGITKLLQKDIDLCDTFIGTHKYMSPERLDSKKYSAKSDVWSFGIIIYTLACGKPPFQAHQYWHNKQMVANNQVQYSGISDQLIHFIKCCLQKNQYIRSSAIELLSHKWIHIHLKGQSIKQWLNNVLK